jgi:hypothetical protein
MLAFFFSLFGSVPFGPEAGPEALVRFQDGFPASGAPSGTDMEWMIVLSVVVPAVLIVVLVYIGSKKTV